MPSVFIIEDDKQIRDELALLLQHNAYETYAPASFGTLVDDIVDANPDIVLLDLGLPHTDGLVICRELREHSDVPIMVITSRDNDMDELMSINLGADDFIAKPYSPHILLARIGTILRRVNKANPSKILSYQGLELDLGRSMVTYKTESAELTKNELRILQILMQNAEQIVTRTDMQQVLWQSDQFIDDNTLTVNINRLRSTLATFGLTDLIQTKRGQGYYLASSS